MIWQEEAIQCLDYIRNISVSGDDPMPREEEGKKNSNVIQAISKGSGMYAFESGVWVAEEIIFTCKESWEN